MSPIRFDDRFFTDALRKAAGERVPAAAAALGQIASKSCVGSEWTGWFDWPRTQGQALCKDVKSYVDSLDIYCDLVLTVGIGGSYLGTRAVSDALSHQFGGMIGRSLRNSRRPHMAFAGQHMSETGLAELLDLLEDRQPVVNIISKSGTTTEPAVAFRVIRGYMERRFGRAEAARRIVATTDGRKGALRRLASEAGYRSFVVPDDVGGRFSVLTAVGLVPLALGGFDVERLLEGADQVFAELRGVADVARLTDHPIVRYAASRAAAFENGKRIELLAYAEPKLLSLVEWWKQLFGESEGKGGQGLFPAGLSYTTDLHSLGQYVQDGVRNLMETFLVVDAPASSAGKDVERRVRVPQAGDDIDELGYLEGRFVGEVNQAAMVGTKLAHHDGGVPCLELSVPSLDERSIGALFAFFETACGVSAALLNVNPYDQPGVEAYKKNLFGLLGKPGFEALGTELRKRI